MSLGSDLRAARIRKKLGQKDIAEQMDVTVQAVSQWERDKTLPSAFNLLRLGQFLDLDVQEYSLSVRDLVNYPETGMTVPIVGDFVSIHFGRENTDSPLSDPSNDFSEMDAFKDYERLVINWSPVGNVMGHRIKDRSMEPYFFEGDVVIIDSGIDPSPGDYVLGQVYPDTVVFRKYRLKGKAEEGRPVIELVPLNGDYPLETIVPGRPKGMDQRGEITGTLRELRRFWRAK